MPRTLFLLNPASGRRRNADTVRAIIQQFYALEGKDFAVWDIDFARLDEMLKEAIQAGFNRIFAVGGDGTVNAIGTRLIGSPIEFGVIPKGSGNGYARNIGFSVRPKLAVRQTLEATPKIVDTGIFDGKPFLNVAGVGLDAEIAMAFSQGHSRGFVPYARNTAEKLMAQKSETYRLTLDGDQQIFEDSIGVVVANGTQWGYDVKAHASASITDGWLDVMVVHKFPLIQAGSIVAKMFQGRFQRSRYVKVFQVKELTIQREGPGYAQIDGEPIEAGAQIAVSILPSSLNLLLPGTLTPEKAANI